MAETVPTRLTPGAGRSFAFSVGVAFLGLAALSYWRGGEVTPRLFAVLGATFLAAGTFVPDRLSLVYRAWMAMGHGVAKITTPILLGVVYFLVITPIGLVMRVFGHHPLRHRERAGSYWVPLQSGGRSNLDNQF
jgi:Ca2+/Na+ antiporter